MNKITAVRKVTNLLKREDYTLKFDDYGNRKYYFDENSLDYIAIEFSSYFTGGGWMKYRTKDFTKIYDLNPVEMLLIRNLFR